MALRTTNEPSQGEITAICAESGAGKTSLADRFPNPYFLNIEGSNNTKSMRHWVKVPTTMKEIYDAMNDFYKETHEYKTLVFDSITQIERILMSDIVEAEKKPFPECAGGFGKAYELVHQRLKEFVGACQRLKEARGVNIVWIFHAIGEEMELPGMPVFQRWMPSLWVKKDGHTNNNLIFMSLSDNWYHLRLNYELSSDASDAGNKVEGDIIRRKVATESPTTRMIGTQPTTSYFAKNRQGVNGEFLFALDKPLALIEGKK